MVRISVLTILFLFLPGLGALAQNSNPNDRQADKGSVYSRFGVGLPNGYSSPAAEGQSLQGVSENEALEPNVSNPALWGDTVYGLATGGLGINNYYATDQTGSATNTNIFLSRFQLQLPLYKGKLGVSASFSPFTQTAFEVERPLPSAGDLPVSGNPDFTNTGSGGISKYELGIGWKINPLVSIGYGASLVHASIDNNFFADLNSSQAQNINYTLQTSASGFGNRFGAYFNIPSIFRAKDHLQIGAVVTVPVQLNGDRTQERTFVTSDPDEQDNNTERTLATGDIHLPLATVLGVTYKPSRELAFTAEGRLGQWSNYSSDLQQNSTNVSFVDRTKVGAGINFNPVYLNSDKFLSHFKYRLGSSYDSGHLKINGQRIQTFMISAGLGILSPARRQGFNSSVDISIHYGLRGTKTSNLVKESFWGVKLSVNLGELFFFRPKLR